MKYLLGLLASQGIAVAANRGTDGLDIEQIEDAPILFQPNESSTLQVGEPYEVRWAAHQPTTITLMLRKGIGKDMRTIATIASDIPNNGTYTWTPSSEPDESYSVMLVDWRGYDESDPFTIRLGNLARDNPDPDPEMSFAEAVCRQTTAKVGKRQEASPAPSVEASSGAAPVTPASSTGAGTAAASSSAKASSAPSTAQSTATPASGSVIQTSASSAANASSQASNSTVPLVKATITSAVMSSVMTSVLRNITSVASIPNPHGGTLFPVNGSAGGTNGTSGYSPLQQVAEAGAKRVEINLALLGSLLIAFA